MAIKLSPETTKQLHASIKRYVAENLDQEIGDLKAGLLLDYCLKEIGPTIYNRAIADAQAYLQERVVDLSSVIGPRRPRIAAGPTPAKHLPKRSEGFSRSFVNKQQINLKLGANHGEVPALQAGCHFRPSEARGR